jgi:transposase-like protein
MRSIPRGEPRFQFQAVSEVLKGDWKAVEVARAYNIHLTTSCRWKQEFLEKDAEVLGGRQGGGPDMKRGSRR